MKTQRWMEALSFCLTAGVTAGALLSSYFPRWTHTFALAGCLMAAGLLAQALRTRQGGYCFPLLAVLGLTGCLIAALPPRGGGSWTLAEAFARRLRDLIDSLGFAHEGTAPLLKAFLTGDRSGLGRDTVAAFRRSGASHLLALSGLHIGIIYTLFSRVLGIFGNYPAARVGRFAVTVPAALFFTLMTGASPSIVRAFLFISLSELTRLLQRRRDPLKVYACALTIQLTLSPLVITSVGFQLSYAAMLGIFLLFPVMQKWYPPGRRFDPVRSIWEVAALSMACQVTTAPIAWLYFHTFPRYFLITNLLAIPLTTAVIALGIGSLALTAAGCCPPVLTGATDACATALLGLLEVIAAL